jgi:hypothetical protein
VVQNGKSAKMLPRREIRSGKGKTRRWQPLHICERIQVTTITIAILMVTLKKSVGNYIQRLTLRIVRSMPRRRSF